MDNVIKCIQVNVNHSWGAQDLLAQYMAENNIDIAFISEPRHIPKSNLWFSDFSGRAAITWFPGLMEESCVLMHRDQEFVAVRLDQICFISCYVSPKCKIKRKCHRLRCRIKEYETFLNRLTSFITSITYTDIILAGDFNARSTLWGDSITTPFGRILEEWVNRSDLRLVNVGRNATCVRPQGRSIIDLTWSSPGLITRVHDWMVMVEKESLSDHLYVSFNIATDKYIFNKRTSNKKWNTKKLNVDLFQASILQGLWDLKGAPMTTADRGVETVEKLVSKALDIAASRSSLFRKPAKHWWNEELSILRSKCVANKRNLARTMRRRDSLAARQVAQDNYKSSRALLRKAIKQAKRKAWRSIVDELERDPWGLAYKAVTGRMIRSSPTASETMSSGSIIYARYSFSI